MCNSELIKDDGFSFQQFSTSFSGQKQFFPSKLSLSNSLLIGGETKRESYGNKEACNAMKCRIPKKWNRGVCVCWPSERERSFLRGKGRNNNVRNPMILFGSKKGQRGRI
jgi:hypothetical protein